MEVYHVENSPSKGSQSRSPRQDPNMNATTEWKSKLSPRARGRLQVALPESENLKNFPGQKDLSIKKEFAMTSNFNDRVTNFGLSQEMSQNKSN